jgi:hypothetical protein
MIRLLRRLSLSALVLAVLAVALVPGAIAAPSPSAAPTLQPAQDYRVVDKGRGVLEFGNDVRIEPGSTIDWVVLFGGDVDVRGRVRGPVVAFGGDVVVSGVVTEEVVAFGGDVRLEETARVGTRLAEDEPGVVAFGGAVTTAAGAQVRGGIERVRGDEIGRAIGLGVSDTVTAPFRALFSFTGWLVLTLVLVVLGLVAAALLPHQLAAVQRHLTLRPWGSLGWGALTFFVLVPLAIVVLVISIVGILLLIPLAVVLPLAYFFAATAAVALVADRLVAGRVADRNRLLLAVTLGITGLMAITWIPVVGALVAGLATVMGTGAAVLAANEWRQRRKAARAGALPSGAPMPPGGPVPPGAPIPPGGQPGGAPLQPWQQPAPPYGTQQTPQPWQQPTPPYGTQQTLQPWQPAPPYGGQQTVGAHGLEPSGYDTNEPTRPYAAQASHEGTPPSRPQTPWGGAETRETATPATEAEPPAARESQPTQPDVPRPAAPQPEVPQPEVPEPEAPQPGVPEPEAPQPDVPEPEAPQAAPREAAPSEPRDHDRPPADDRPDEP